MTIIFFPLFEWVPGADQQETLKSRNNLAMSHLDAGRTAEAIRLYERTLADCERVLGADHQGTLRSRNNLAMSYQAAGRTAEAVRLLERTLADCERMLGADHPDTKAVRENLGALTGEPQRHAAREKLKGAASLPGPAAETLQARDTAAPLRDGYLVSW